MRLVFAGTPEFARVAYIALRDAGHDIRLVLTQPDRPAGRGLKLTPSPVKLAALEDDVKVIQPRSLRLDGKYPDDALLARDALAAAKPDVMIVAAYGLILPEWVLTLPAHGCLNIHASLLPRWRGAAPIQRAIEAGDEQTGVTIMQMDAGLDTGPMLLSKAIPITPAHTAATLHDELAELGGRLMVNALDEIACGRSVASAQPAEGVTYAAKLEKAEAVLDLTQDAATLARRIHAFNPAPGANLRLPGLADPVKVWRAQASPDTPGAPPGSVLRASAEGIEVATGNGILRLLELQKAGGKRQPADAFVRGWTSPS